MTNVKPETLNSFKQMWNLHPSPVLLVHKNRDILAVNKAAAEAQVPVGIKCYDLCKGDNVCAGCKANASLKKNEGIRKLALSKGTDQFMDGYWIPVEGEEDIYVHFGNDITEYVKPELLIG